MKKTFIPWATHVWNPFEGCSPVSPGCRNCYAASFAHRFHRPWGKPVYRPAKLTEPLRTRKCCRRIFVCSTSDLFHPDIGLDALEAVWRVIWSAQLEAKGTFIILTKRPAVMAERLPILLRRVFGNDESHFAGQDVWLGVTAEDQQRADERIPILLTIPAAVHFVSVEPMLGPVNLLPHMNPSNEVTLDWVIAGPETGAKKRPFDSVWMKDIEAQCEIAGVPFFDKRDGYSRTREYPK